MVKRSRRCPLKAKSWVRFPLEVPELPFAVAGGFSFYIIVQNHPREQEFDAWRTSADVKAGSARFLFLDDCAKLPVCAKLPCFADCGAAGRVRHVFVDGIKTCGQENRLSDCFLLYGTYDGRFQK